MMHLGTNDIILNRPNILEAFTKLVSQMRESNPNMKIIVGSILWSLIVY